MNHILSILILNRNSSDNVLSLCEDLKEQTFKNFQIIISDDNSKKSEYDKLLELKDSNIRIISYPKPFKFGLVKKWNFGFKEALLSDPKYIYILQSDQQILNKNLLETLIKYMEKNKRCGSVGPTMLDRNGQVTWGSGIIKKRMGKEYICSESFMIRSKCLVEMGLWKDIFIYYGEEMDYFNWLKENNYYINILPEIQVKHYGGGVTSKFQNHKDYFRPRTSILIMKLYNRDDRFFTKLKYLREECGEQEAKIKYYVKNWRIVQALRTLILLFLGTIVGLLIPIKQNKEGYQKIV